MRQRISFLILLSAFFFLARNALAENPTPRGTRVPTPLPGGSMLPVWMTPPASGETQAEAGAVVYYYRCMACHGDQQQGLTTEWRAQWDVEHQNCARSACHGARPPPEGFSFPKNFAPALVGENTLTRFENARALYEFIRARMPYQAPGSLTDDEARQLVAFLLKRRGVVATNVNAANAARMALLPARENVELEGFAALSGGIFLGALIYFLYRHKRA